MPKRKHKKIPRSFGVFFYANKLDLFSCIRHIRDSICFIAARI